MAKVIDIVVYHIQRTNIFRNEPYRSKVTADWKKGSHKSKKPLFRYQLGIPFRQTPNPFTASHGNHPCVAAGADGLGMGEAGSADIVYSAGFWNEWRA